MAERFWGILKKLIFFAWALHIKHLSSPKERTHTYIAKKNRRDCGVDVQSAMNTLFRTHNTNNSKEQNTTIRPHNANNSNKGLLNSSQLQKPIVVNGRFWEEIQKYCFWIGHIYFWIGHIYFWIRLICFWIRHICFWIGHILCKLPCSTISIFEKCQRRKGLVSSK